MGSGSNKLLAGVKNLPNNLTTKEKIIYATMDIIAEEGFQNTTTRKIAAKAGVNVAAVNYHFGSKDAVINEAFKTVTLQLKNTFQFLKADDQDDMAKLMEFVKNYTSILSKYPDIIKNMIDHAIHDKLLDEQLEYVTFLKSEGIELIKQTIERIKPGQDELWFYLRTLQLVSSISYPFLMGERVQEVLGVDLSQQQMQQTYIQMLLTDVCR